MQPLVLVTVFSHIRQLQLFIRNDVPNAVRCLFRFFKFSSLAIGTYTHCCVQPVNVARRAVCNGIHGLRLGSCQFGDRKGLVLWVAE